MAVVDEMGSESEAKGRLLVLYASQTGNAMDVAERVGREAERGGCPLVEVMSMDRFNASCLAGEKIVIFVVSTTGQGDPPDSMKVFWKYLLQRSLGNQWLQNLNYAVFGLGDSGYQKYNFAAKKLDKRLSDLGATAIIEKGLGDDQHRAGYEGALDPWLSSLWKSLNQMSPEILPRYASISDPSLRNTDRPKFQVIYHSAGPLEEDTMSISGFERVMEVARSMSPAQFLHDKRKPQYLLQIITNKSLTNEDNGRDVRHFEFESLSSILDYQVGDILEILPSQDSSAVDAFLKRCNLNPESYITVKPAEQKFADSITKNLNYPVKLRTFVELTMDVASASPRCYFFEVMSFYASAEHEKEKLQYFASPEGRDDLYEYNQKERRNVLEVLEDFPSVQMPFEWLVQLVPPLKTRAFSISSSPLAHRNQIHLTVSIVSWITPFKRKRHGLCSSWLAGLDPHENKERFIPAWISRGSFNPPPLSLPLILVGPGTGCAPFRAFIEERALQNLDGSAAPILFFFGCRNQENDFLYKDFWLSQAEGLGVLSPDKGGGFFVAFSRDQPRKVYVQHKMKEESERIWKLLSEGAAVYIAGSSTKMPEDVTRTLEEIIAEEGGMLKESAVKWLRLLEKAGRFNIEAWS